VSGPETSLIIKPSGFWQTLVKCFIKSRVDSRKPFIKIRVDSRKCFIKSRVDSRKPFIKSWVDSRKCFIKSQVDSRKSCTKPSGFGQNLLRNRVDSRKSCTKPSGFGRNLLRNRVDFRQTFISRTYSLQVFSLKVSCPQCLSYVGHYSSKGNWRYFFRMLVIIPVKVIDGISFVCWSLSQ